jgi:hypothetical protein
LLDSVTVAPPVFDTVTVHIELAPEPKLVGLHVSPLTTDAVASAMVAVAVPPFNVAVTVAVWSVVIVPAVAVNVAVVLPDPTVTEAGTVSTPALLDSVTVAPPVFDTVTVHVALAPEPRLVGLHVSPLSTTGATSEIVAVCVLPFSFAVTVAVWSLVIVPAVAMNVAVVLPDPTVTEAGTVNAAALLDKETTAPPAGAEAFSEAVHVANPPEPRDAGAQLTALRVGSGAVPVTMPPTPLSGSEVPAAETPNVFVTLIGVLATPDAIVTLTTATTPFCITVVLKPASKHA